MKYLLILLMLVGCSTSTYSPQFKKGEAVLSDNFNLYGYVVEEANQYGNIKVILVGNYTKDHILIWNEKELISMYTLGYFHGQAKLEPKYTLPQYEDGWKQGRKDARNTTYQR